MVQNRVVTSQQSVDAKLYLHGSEQSSQKSIDAKLTFPFRNSSSTAKATETKQHDLFQATETYFIEVIKTSYIMSHQHKRSKAKLLLQSTTF
jgi:hypothetical protein